jgi:hypothetical protein
MESLLSMNGSPGILFLMAKLMRSRSDFKVEAGICCSLGRNVEKEARGVSPGLMGESDTAFVDPCIYIIESGSHGIGGNIDRDEGFFVKLVVMHTEVDFARIVVHDGNIESGFYGLARLEEGVELACGKYVKCGFACGLDNFHLCLLM